MLKIIFIIPQNNNFVKTGDVKKVQTAKRNLKYNTIDCESIKSV